MTTPIGQAAAPGQAVHQNFFFIDLLKAVAAQLIVLHHLAFYGPMADHVRPVLPALIDWLDSHARIAVQVFLVVAGFLAARSLSPRGEPGIIHPLPLAMRRYLKLAPPFLVAVLLAIGASAWARIWMTHDSISAPPDMFQVAAHALFLHSILGYESLSAGVWYVAIDFQLYALFACLLWACGRVASHRAWPWLVPCVIAAGVGASLFYFNRDSDWDVWAPYFFGSYGLGILACWASDPVRRPRTVALLLATMLLPTLVALMIDFRLRIAVALVVACLLVLARRAGASNAAREFPVVGGLARISYSVFLIHFPVCLVMNAAFTRFVPHHPYAQAIGMLVAWIASLLAGAAFYRWIELPLSRMLAHRRARRVARLSASTGS